MNTKRFPEAEQEYKKTLEIDPEHELAKKNLAKLQKMMKSVKKPKK